MNDYPRGSAQNLDALTILDFSLYHHQPRVSTQSKSCLMSLINAISRISARPRQNLLSLRSLSSEHRKRPSRGGQNFTDRYKRLEKSLRGKDAYASESDELRQSTLTGPTSGNSSPGSPSSSVLFHGLTIPDKPQEPADDGAPITCHKYSYFF